MAYRLIQTDCGVSITKMKGLWYSHVVARHLWDTFDFALFIVILESFSALVYKTDGHRAKRNKICDLGMLLTHMRCAIE